MRKLLFFLFSFFSINVYPQIVIDNIAPYNTPTYLIDNILLGGGITATNHSFIGDSNQIGFFNGVASNLGIDSGIVLSSGNVFDLVGPNASGSTSTSYSLPGDATLDAVIFPDPTNDAAVLEFDFVPTSDTISFKYVFGSEEYLEFVASFNDAFGFFLSGPNPTGGMYVDQNLAIVPGTANTPVSIFNVNNVSNSAYYVDNGDGFTAPQNSDPTVIQFDGFTTPLTATAAVNCGDTYHIKLVVADAVDNAYDSGIFLEAGSFFSPTLEVNNDLGIDSTYLDIPCNSTVELIASGGNGATYQWFDSTSTVIGVDSTIIVGEGIYIVSADILGCAIISDTIRVLEGDFPVFDLGDDLTIPCNSTTLVDPIVSGGTAPYSYLWNSGEIDSMLILSEGIYSVVITDVFGCFDADTLEIFYDPPPVVDCGPDFMIPCNADTFFSPIVSGGTAPYSYLWSSGDTDSELALSEGVYNIIVTDAFGCSGSDMIEISYDSAPSIDLGSNYNIACNTKTTLSANVIGGTSPYSYLWSNGSTDLSIDVGEGDYTLIVSDFYDCSDSDGIQITEDSPGTVTVIGGETICDGNTSVITFDFDGLLPWSLVFSDGYINRSIPLITAPTFNYTTLESGVYSVVDAEDINGCEADDTGIADIIVNPLPVPVIDPEFYEIYEGEEITLSTGNYSYYEWFSGEDILIDTLSSLTVVDSGIFYVSVIDYNGCEGLSAPTIVDLIPLTQLFVPSAFTPNNDYHNELFVIQGLFVESFNIKIFSSWGEQIFESDQIDKYWDGTFNNRKVSQGKYSYTINVVGADGKVLNKTGTVSVLY